jgi:hypothetical protein
MHVNKFNSQPIIARRRNKPAGTGLQGFNDMLDPGFEDLGARPDVMVAPGVLAHFSRNEPQPEYVSLPQLERC